MGFVMIYVILSQNLFCRNLHTFMWRKIEPKIAYVEKKWQILGMYIELALIINHFNIFLKYISQGDQRLDN